MTTDPVPMEKTRAQIEAERMADPWPWIEELHAWSRRHGSIMTTRWDFADEDENPPPLDNLTP